MRVLHFKMFSPSVECFQWDSYIEASDCIEQSLINNFWASSEELAAMEEADINNLLVQKLNYYYDSQIHSIVDLSMREVTGDKGSLCGMAGLYQAASQTILTVSQLKQMSFLDVKAQVGERLGYDLAASKKQKDVEIINEFHRCKFLLKERFIETDDINIVLVFCINPLTRKKRSTPVPFKGQTLGVVKREAVETEEEISLRSYILIYWILNIDIEY